MRNRPANITGGSSWREVGMVMTLINHGPSPSHAISIADRCITTGQMGCRIATGWKQRRLLESKLFVDTFSSFWSKVGKNLISPETSKLRRKPGKLKV